MHLVNTYKGNGLHLYNDHKNERGDSGWGWGGGAGGRGGKDGRLEF